MVELVEPNFTAKITGMLLELDRTQIFKLIESPEAFKEKVYEAIYVLIRKVVSPTNEARRTRS